MLKHVKISRENSEKQKLGLKEAKKFPICLKFGSVTQNNIFNQNPNPTLLHKEVHPSWDTLLDILLRIRILLKN